MGKVINFSDEKLGSNLKLDIDNGYVYDAGGNQIAKWAVSNQDFSELTAAYCSEYAASRTAQALSTVNPSHAQQFMMSWREGLGGESVKMDLGPSDVHIPAGLPNYAAGYRNELPMADVVSAPLIVNQISGKYWTFSQNDAFEDAAPVINAAGQVPEISPRPSNSNYSTVEYALGGFVDVKLEAAADAPLRIRQATAKRIMDVLTIRREKRVATLLQTAGSWDSSTRDTIASTYQWNGGTNAVPIKDLQTRVEKSLGGVSGILMSRRVWNAFSRNSSVQDFLKYKDSVEPIPGPARVSQAFGLPPIYVADMKARNVSTGVIDYIWGNHVVLFRMPDQSPPVSQDDIATSYTFRWNATGVKDGVASGGFLVREYFVQDRGSHGGNKIVIIHHDHEVMTSAYVGGLLIDAYQ